MIKGKGKNETKRSPNKQIGRIFQGCDHDQKMQYVGNDDCWLQRGSRGGIEGDQVTCGDM